MLLTSLWYSIAHNYWNLLKILGQNLLNLNFLERLRKFSLWKIVIIDNFLGVRSGDFGECACQTKAPKARGTVECHAESHALERVENATVGKIVASSMCFRTWGHAQWNLFGKKKSLGCEAGVVKRGGCEEIVRAFNACRDWRLRLVQDAGGTVPGNICS